MTAPPAPDQPRTLRRRATAGVRRRRRRFLAPGPVIFALLVAGGLVLAVTVMQRTTVGPTVQLPLAMEGMPAHLLNVWIEPDVLRVGEAAVTAQVVDLGGNARVASSIGFRIARTVQQEGEQAPLVDGVALAVTGRTIAGRFRAVLPVGEPGAWLIEVVVQMQGRTASVRFPVEVGP